MYPRVVAKMSSCQYMQLVGGEWTILLNSYLAPRLGGIKQKNCIIHCWASGWFLLFYSLKPCSQVWILLYWNWSIVQQRSSFGSSFFLSPMKVAGGNPWPLVTALCTHSPPPAPHLKGLISISSKWWTTQSWHYCYLLIQQIIFLEKMINFIDSVWSLKLLSTQHILLYLLKCLKIHNKTQVRMNSALFTH